MKLKSRRCSTGHGTGVTPPVELQRLLKSRTSMFVGRANLGRLGTVERDHPLARPRASARRERGRGRMRPEREGYFRKKRLAVRERAITNIRNLRAWA